MRKSKGVRTVVYLQEGEKMLIVKPDRTYRTGYPTEEILFGNTLLEAVPVTWDEISQEWLA